MGFPLPLPAGCRERGKRKWEDQPPTRQVCHRASGRQGRFAPLKRWPPKVAAILDRRSHGGSAEMRSGRKNGSAGVKQKNETAGAKQVRCQLFISTIREGDSGASLTFLTS